MLHLKKKHQIAERDEKSLDLRLLVFLRTNPNSDTTSQIAYWASLERDELGIYKEYCDYNFSQESLEVIHYCWCLATVLRPTFEHIHQSSFHRQEGWELYPKSFGFLFP